MVLRYSLYPLAGLLLVAAALFFYTRVDQQLAGNPRFHLGADDPQGGENSPFRIRGVNYTPREKILGVFSPDFGRSVYLLPLLERRRSLLAIDWVKEATVSRLWPDRLEITILERTPVAFVQLPVAGGRASSDVALIDAEGVILEQPSRARFNLPVLTGIRREQSREMRRQRVSIAQRLVAEIGGLAAQISEIDVADPENVKVVQALEGQVVTLSLGRRNFLARLRKFLDHYPEIRRHAPGAVLFDLRLDDRVAASAEEKRRG